MLAEREAGREEGDAFLMCTSLRTEFQCHMRLLVTLTSLYSREPLRSFCHIGAKQPLEMNVI